MRRLSGIDRITRRASALILASLATLVVAAPSAVSARDTVRATAAASRALPVADASTPNSARVVQGKALRARRVGVCIDGSLSVPADLTARTTDALARAVEADLAAADRRGFPDTTIYVRWITEDSTAPSALAAAFRLHGIETPPRLKQLSASNDVNPFDRHAKQRLSRRLADTRTKYQALVADRNVRTATLRRTASFSLAELRGLQPPGAKFTDLMGCPVALSSDLRSGDVLIIASDFRPDGSQSAAGSQQPYSLHGVKVFSFVWCTEPAASCRDHQAQFSQIVKSAAATSATFLTPEEVQTHDLKLG